MWRFIFWKKLFHTIHRQESQMNFMVQPDPTVAELCQFHLVNYEIPLTENFGDC